MQVSCIPSNVGMDPISPVRYSTNTQPAQFSLKSDDRTAADEYMMRKTSAEAPGAIRARLAYLRSRKAALDELIHCMEQYALYLSPAGRPRVIKSVHVKSAHHPPLRRLAGAA